jgi:hypothetical protein
MAWTLLVGVGGAVVGAGALSSGRCELSANWFGEVKGDWRLLDAFSLGGCGRSLFLIVCQGWVIGDEGCGMGGDRGHMGDCGGIALPLTCGGEGESAGLVEWRGSV